MPQKLFQQWNAICKIINIIVWEYQESGVEICTSFWWKGKWWKRDVANAGDATVTKEGWESGILHKLTRRCSGRVSAGREQRPPGHRVVAVDEDGSLGILVVVVVVVVVVVMTLVVGLNPRLVSQWWGEATSLPHCFCHELSTDQLRFGVHNVDFVLLFYTKFIIIFTSFKCHYLSF